tara:strand:- start:7720 stop:8304 length:585 start_codon:yes stop_codon:yes gene_type:complete
MMKQNDNGKTQKLTESLKAEIRREFIHGATDAQGVLQYPSIDALVDKFNVARSTLYRHSVNEDWQAQKNRYQTELDEQVKQARRKDYIQKSQRLDDNALQLAQSLMTKVARKIRDDELQIQNDPEYEGMTAGVLDKLASVVGQAQKIGKLALGEAQEIAKVSGNVAVPQSFREIIDELDQFAKRKSEGGKHTIQ